MPVSLVLMKATTCNTQVCNRWNRLFLVAENLIVHRVIFPVDTILQTLENPLTTLQLQH